MYLLINPSLDCYYNLALEEYLLRHTDKNFIVLWRSSDSVVIGKHQNLHAEVVEPVAIENKIEIARRLSGGGTVFHDLGNINFSFIKTGKEGQLVNFRSFIEPISIFLNQLGVPAELSERNDIMIGEKKISGNAEHVFKKRVLHHGTLLFNSNLEKLSGVLRKDSSMFKGRGVQSVRKPVTLISDFIAEKIPTEGFIERLSTFLIEQFSLESYSISDEERQTVEQIANKKFRTKEWIYEYSPNFELNRTIQGFDVTIGVKSGKIDKLEGLNLSPTFKTQVKGIRFDYLSLKEKCENDQQRQLIKALFY